jgi:hypothetical protein
LLELLVVILDVAYAFPASFFVPAGIEDDPVIVVRRRKGDALPAIDPVVVPRDSGAAMVARV